MIFLEKDGKNEIKKSFFLKKKSRFNKINIFEQEL
jgi:hypothetical protein